MNIEWIEFSKKTPLDGDIVYVTDGHRIGLSTFIMSDNQGTWQGESFKPCSYALSYDGWEIDIIWWAKYCPIALPKKLTRKGKANHRKNIHKRGS